MALLAVGLGIGIPALIEKGKQKQRDAERDQDVERIVTNLLNNMDKSVDPCDNFYQYSCGNFMKNWSGIPPRENVISLIEKQIAKNTEDLIITNTPEPQPSFSKKQRIFFDSCMNEEILRKLKQRPLTKLLEDLGGWPLLQASTVLQDDWLQLMSLIRNKSICSDIFIEMSVLPDIYDESSYILMINMPSQLGINPAYFQSANVMDIYKQYIRNSVDFLGGNATKAANEIEDMFQFERDIAELMTNVSASPASQLYERMSISELHSLIPKLDWFKYINIVLPYEVDAKHVILVRGLNYFIELAILLERTNIRTLTNYMLWRIVTPSGLRYTEYNENNPQATFYRLLGSAKVNSRLQECADDTSHFMNLAINANYIRRYISPELKKEATKFIQGVEIESKEALNSYLWMDDKSKEIAKMKLQNIKYQIAYPDEILDDAKVNEFYDELEVNEKTLFQNVLNVKWFIKMHNFYLLKKNQFKWATFGDILKPKAAYSVKNDLTITLPFLQAIYYDMNGLASLNFGALGAIIGHELFHSMDRKGSEYDEKGVSNSWWTTDTSDNFSIMEDCFIRKYSNFTLPNTEEHVNGISTAAENLADNMGLFVAFKAFKKWLSENKPERLPKNLPVTSNQLFWISYANMYCSKLRDEWTLYLLRNDPHSPDIFRVNGAVSNLREFAHDFQCRPKSNMLSYQRCALD